MGKQTGGKSKGKAKPKPKAKRKSPVPPEGDLTTIEAHVEAFLAGTSEAATVLTEMGRDAAFTVMQLAKEKKHEELEQFARRLAAIPPQVTTNLHDLRRRSVRRRVEMERREALKAVEVTDLAISGGAVALFDPQRVVEDLATGGRPRRHAERLGAGDIACLGLPQADPVPVRILAEPPPADQPVARLRLHVESGLIFVGPPEASDGPRMGTVRLDPFSTALDDLADRGRFLRMANGVWALWGYIDPDGAVRLHAVPDEAPTEPLELSPMAPVTLPRA